MARPGDEFPFEPPQLMKALADEQMSDLAGTFGRHLEVRTRPGRSITPDDLGDAEVLLVRSVTRVDAGLLEGSRVRFVGSATIGTDHLDTDWLDARGIAWASAPGCNAESAAQYTLGMMLLACRRMDQRLDAQRVALIGHGNVGRHLHRLLDRLGVTVTVCDPPLTETGALTDGASHREAFGCDIVSLHVPYTETGLWATAGLVGEEQFDWMPMGGLLVNTSRGGVVDRSALNHARHVHLALDTWPGEPDIVPDLLARATVATPHVAGYSVEGKLRGTRMVLEAFLRWSGQSAPPVGADAPATDAVALDLSRGLDGSLTSAIIAATKVESDDARMRSAGPIDATQFDRLRRAHTPRHEFLWTRPDQSTNP